MNFPFRRKAVKDKRDEPRRVRGRVRLQDAAAMKELRLKVFTRSGGKCEAEPHAPDCPGFADWNEGELSHDQHGPWKSDTPETTRWSTKQCHRFKHSAGKPVRRRPGRPMSLAEARKYWEGRDCYCEAGKPQNSALCSGCLSQLSPQARLDLAELTNRDWLTAMADAEKELLRKGV